MTQQPERDALEAAARDHCDGEPIRTAPKDGTEIMIRVIHPAARYYKDPVAEGYDAWCKAKWIDHNGGGWTWMGVAGTPVQWRSMADSFADLKEPESTESDRVEPSNPSNLAAGGEP